MKPQTVCLFLSLTHSHTHTHTHTQTHTHTHTCRVGSVWLFHRKRWTSWKCVFVCACVCVCVCVEVFLLQRNETGRRDVSSGNLNRHNLFYLKFKSHQASLILLLESQDSDATYKKVKLKVCLCRLKQEVRQTDGQKCYLMFVSPPVTFHPAADVITTCAAVTICSNNSVGSENPEVSEVHKQFPFVCTSGWK